MVASARFSRINRFIDRIGAIETPVSIELPDGNKRDVREGDPQFHVALRSPVPAETVPEIDPMPA